MIRCFVGLLFGFALLSSGASAKDACSDVFVEGTRLTVSGASASYLRTSRFSSIRRDSSSSTDAALKVLEYGSGAYSDKTRTIASDDQFQFLDEGEASSFALSSGDKTLVNAWLACMMLNKPGPVAWVTASNAQTVVLHMRYIPPIDNDIHCTFFSCSKLSFVLDGDVVIPPGLSVKSGSTYLRNGTEIGTGERAVEFQVTSTDREFYKTPLHFQINADERAIDADLPPRMVVELKENPTAKVADVPVTADSAVHLASVYIEVKNPKALVPDSVKVKYLNPSIPNKAQKAQRQISLVYCDGAPKYTVDSGGVHVVAKVHSDASVSGICHYQVT